MWQKLTILMVLLYATNMVFCEDVYDTKFDNVDLDELLQQERLLKNYIKCLENKGHCTPDAKMLKETLPDAIATNCAKCSMKQKYGSEKVTHFLIDQRPEDWQRLEKIYDPQGTYKTNYLMQKKYNNPETTTIQAFRSKGKLIPLPSIIFILSAYIMLMCESSCTNRPKNKNKILKKN